MQSCPTCGQVVLEGLPEYAGVILDESRVEIRWKGLACNGLTGKEFGLFAALHHAKGRVMSKGAILDRLYAGMDEPEQKIVDVFVCKLKKKLLEAFGENGPSTATVWGRGYRLEVPGVDAPADPAAHAHDNALAVPA